MGLLRFFKKKNDTSRQMNRHHDDAQGGEYAPYPDGYGVGQRAGQGPSPRLHTGGQQESAYAHNAPQQAYDPRYNAQPSPQGYELPMQQGHTLQGSQPSFSNDPRGQRSSHYANAPQHSSEPHLMQPQFSPQPSVSNTHSQPSHPHPHLQQVYPPQGSAPSQQPSLDYGHGGGDYIGGYATTSHKQQTTPQLSAQPQTSPFFSASPANHSKPQHSNSDLRDLRFWDNGPVGDDAMGHDNDEDESEPQPLRFILALGILIIFAAFAWLVFRWSTQSVSTTPPHIQADQDPFKVRPDNPGGLVVPHQDKLVYGRIGAEGNIGDQHMPTERLLPPPEQPMQPYGQPYAQPYAQSQGHQGQSHPQQQGPSYGPQGQPQYQGQPPQGYNQGYAQPYDQQGVPPHYQNNQSQPYQGQPQYQGQPPQGGYSPQGATPFYPQGQEYNQGYAPPHAYPQQQGGYPQQGQHQQSYPQQGDEEEGAFYPDNLAQKPSPQQVAPPTQQQSPKKTPPSHQASESPTPEMSSDLPTGFLGVPQSSPSQHNAQSITPSFYKAKLASLETKAAAEREWDRLKAKGKDSFKNLNKAIVKETTNGKSFYVLYALGLQGEETAKALCKKLGNCTYHKQ